MANVLTTLKSQFASIARQSFNRIYPATGVDSLQRCLVKKNPADPDSLFLAAEIDPFIDDPLTQFTSFIGIPNAQLEPNTRQSARNLLANFTGWRNKHSLTRNIITAILVTPLHLIATPFNLVTNCAKVFTEWLPRLLGEFTIKVGAKFFDAAQKRSHRTLGDKLINAGLYLLGSLFVLATYPLTAASIVFGALTSPIETVRSGWVVGKHSAGRKGALVLGGAALFLVLAVYTLAFPFVLKFLGLALMKMAPKVVLHSINHLAPRFKPIFDSIGKGLTPLTKFLGKFLGQHIGPMVAKMPIQVGISCVAGPITALSGNLYQPAAERIKRWVKREKPVAHFLETIRQSSKASSSANQQLGLVRERLLTSTTADRELKLAAPKTQSTEKPSRRCQLFTPPRKTAEWPKSTAMPERKQTGILMQP